ncbi:hypothetical protein [Alkalihalobacterium chitinilyticum]|uniref:Serpentine receptor class gamma n=1 Tax=Alkalihalobacterium chitinilyticum TaxID=2980103 RepID=A0ABT5VHC5_9BACI|nr:hypothetical protein [Alkalihalobacterium chitinilyticum]MDE5413624.1 hypothetical protein [Alkalihalobacterium chitinilyticum]
MKNRLLYLSLNLCSILLLIYTLRSKTKKVNKKYFWPLYFAFTGLNYFFEFFVLVIGKAYEYDPKILKKQYFDSIFGSTVSQLFVVPTISLFMNMFQLKTRWPTFFSLLLSLGIESFFVKQKIFKLNWWATPYTTVGLQLFYVIAKYWTIQVTEKKNRVFEVLTVFFSVFVCYSTMNFLHVSLFRTCFFNVPLFKNRYRSHVTLSTLYSGLSSIFFVVAILKNIKRRATITVVSFILLETLLIKAKVIKIYSYPAFYTASLVTKVASMAIGKFIHQKLYENNGSTALDCDKKEEMLV